MKQLIILIAFFFLFQITRQTFAQTDSSKAYEIAVESTNSVPITATVFVNEHPSKKEQFTSDWTIGNINFADGTSAKNCNLRYNCWKDELIYLRNSDFKTGTVIKSSVNDFNFNTNTGSTHFIKYEENNALVKQVIYLEALTEGEISLYCHRKVTFIKSNNVFTKNHQYFLKKEGVMIKINIQKSSIMPLFTDDQQKTIKTIIRDNHLKFKNEYDLAKAFSIYNKSKSE